MRASRAGCDDRLVPKWTKRQIEFARSLVYLDHLHQTFRECGQVLDLPTTQDIRDWDAKQAREAARARRDRQPEGVERRYTVPELAAIWKISDNAARALIVNEPGVIEMVGPKRTRRLIPESVKLRVDQRSRADTLQTARSSRGPLRVVRKRNSRTAVVQKVR